MINVQHLRGGTATTPAATVYTGPPGELLVDEDVWGIRVQDGTTPGGHLIGAAPTSFIIDNIQVTIGTSENLLTLAEVRTAVIWTSATAGAKTTTLPDPALWDGYEVTVKLTVGDGSAHTIVAAAGTIDGAADADFTDVNTLPKMSMTLWADATNNAWWVK